MWVPKRRPLPNWRRLRELTPDLSVCSHESQILGQPVLHPCHARPTRSARKLIYLPGLCSPLPSPSGRQRHAARGRLRHLREHKIVVLAPTRFIQECYWIHVSERPPPRAMTGSAPIPSVSNGALGLMTLSTLAGRCLRSSTQSRITILRTLTTAHSSTPTA